MPYNTSQIKKKNFTRLTCKQLLHLATTAPPVSSGAQSKRRVEGATSIYIAKNDFIPVRSPLKHLQ